MFAATLPTQERIQHDRQPTDDEASDHMAVDSVESDEGESVEEFESPLPPLARTELDEDTPKEIPLEDGLEGRTQPSEGLEGLTQPSEGLEGLTQPSPLKEIEETEPEDKLVVIEDSPNPKAETPEECSAIIQDLQRKLANAKRERLSKNLSSASGQKHCSLCSLRTPKKLCFV